jgi:hypothetical protein
MFVGKARSYPRGEYLKDDPHWYASVVLINIRLGWTDLSRTNTLAYFEKFVNYDSKTFCNIWEEVRKACQGHILHF